MSWLEELDALLNKSSAEELEKIWAKYDEFDCGPEVEEFINSSIWVPGGQVNDISIN